MKTKIILFLVFIVTILLFSACPKISDSNLDDEKPKTDSILVETVVIDSVSTEGTLGSVSTPDDNGNITMICNDENGGRYEFTQQSLPRRSTTNGGMWSYFVGEIEKFSGSYTGDISSLDTPLSLVVEKAADASGKLQVTTETKSFSFNVDVSNNNFTATIPSVEIKVEEKEPTLSIKTLTKSINYQNQRFDFYSDNSFELFISESSSVNDFSYQISGIYGVGKYVGDPKKDGIIFIEVEKSIDSKYVEFEEQIFQAYKAGENSKNIEIQLTDLVEDKRFFYYYIEDKNIVKGIGECLKSDFEEGDRVVSISITGDDSEKFKIEYSVENSSAISSFPIDIPISVLDGYAEVNVYPFLDANDDGEFNYGTEMSLNYQITTISGKKTVANLNIVKSKINFKVKGDLSTTVNPKLRAAGQYTDFNQGIVAIDKNTNTNTGEIEVYWHNQSGVDKISFYVFDDKNDDFLCSNEEVKLSERVDVLIYEDGTTPEITINLDSKLSEEQQIEIKFSNDLSNELTEDQKNQYGFFRTENDAKIYFNIPVGAETNGNFIFCSQCEQNGNSECNSNDHFLELLKYCFIVNSKINEAENNFKGQLIGLTQNMKDIVEVLENRHNFEVFGKELIGLTE